MDTLTASIAEALEKGQTYLVKIDSKRATRLEYVGTRWFETPEDACLEFYGAGGTKFLYGERITDIKLASPLKAKEKKGVTCTRCLGNKVYQKFSHINGGRCFKCDGTGII